MAELVEGSELCSSEMADLIKNWLKIQNEKNTKKNPTRWLTGSSPQMASAADPMLRYGRPQLALTEHQMLGAFWDFVSISRQEMTGTQTKAAKHNWSFNAHTWYI